MGLFDKVKQVRRDGGGGGDDEVGPRFVATGKNDERSVSVVFGYPPEGDESSWNAAEQAEWYGTAGGESNELQGIGDRAWLSADDMIAVLAAGRAFYVYGGGSKPSTPSTDGLQRLAALVASTIPAR